MFISSYICRPGAASTKMASLPCQIQMPKKSSFFARRKENVTRKWQSFPRLQSRMKKVSFSPRIWWRMMKIRMSLLTFCLKDVKKKETAGKEDLLFRHQLSQIKVSFYPFSLFYVLFSETLNNKMVC